MADLTLDELRARLHPTGDGGEWVARDELALMVDGIDAAIKQREQDKLDAARYRWLAEVCGDADLFMETRNKSELDARIDAAMTKESGNG